MRTLTSSALEALEKAPCCRTAATSRTRNRHAQAKESASASAAPLPHRTGENLPAKSAAKLFWSVQLFQSDDLTMGRLCTSLSRRWPRRPQGRGHHCHQLALQDMNKDNELLRQTRSVRSARLSTEACSPTSTGTSSRQSPATIPW